MLCSRPLSGTNHVSKFLAQSLGQFKEDKLIMGIYSRSRRKMKEKWQEKNALLLGIWDEIWFIESIKPNNLRKEQPFTSKRCHKSFTWVSKRWQLMLRGRYVLMRANHTLCATTLFQPSDFFADSSIWGNEKFRSRTKLSVFLIQFRSHTLPYRSHRNALVISRRPVQEIFCNRTLAVSRPPSFKQFDFEKKEIFTFLSSFYDSTFFLNLLVHRSKYCNTCFVHLFFCKLKNKDKGWKNTISKDIPWRMK